MIAKWKKKYIELLKSGKEADAFNLRLANIPQALFKYRSLNENTLNCLRYSSVWLASADSQNDPYESSLFYSDTEMALAIYKSSNFKNEFIKNYGTEISDSEIESIIEDENPERKFREICKLKGVQRDYNDMSDFRENNAKQLMDKVKREMMISCFSERNDSILMWSHYTENNRGICIEYDLRNETDVNRVLEPVCYSDKLISLSKAFGTKNYTNIIREAAITKASDWKYEKEWRVVFPNENGGHFKMPKPKKIYLGSRFNENTNEIYKEYLFDLCTKRNIPIQEMKIHDSEYKIVEKV